MDKSKQEKSNRYCDEKVYFVSGELHIVSHHPSLLFGRAKERLVTKCPFCSDFFVTSKQRQNSIFGRSWSIAGEHVFYAGHSYPTANHVACVMEHSILDLPPTDSLVCVMPSVLFAGQPDAHGYAGSDDVQDPVRLGQSVTPAARVALLASPGAGCSRVGPDGTGFLQREDGRDPAPAHGWRERVGGRARPGYTCPDIDRVDPSC